MRKTTIAIKLKLYINVISSVVLYIQSGIDMQNFIRVAFLAFFLTLHTSVSFLDIPIKGIVIDI